MALVDDPTWPELWETRLKAAGWASATEALQKVTKSHTLHWSWGFKAKTLGTKSKVTNILSDELYPYRLINTDFVLQWLSVPRSQMRMISISGFSNPEGK